MKNTITLLLLSVFILFSCNDSNEIVGEIKDHRYDPTLTISDGTTNNGITDISIGNPITISINVNNTTTDTYNITPVISGNATITHKDKELKNNTPIAIEIIKNGVVQFLFNPSSSGDIDITLTFDNSIMVKTITHKFRVSKREIVFGSDKVNLKTYVNTPTTFKVNMAAPQQGITYTLKLEKLSGTGILSNSVQKDIAHNATIEIPTSFEIPFTYISNEVGNHQLRFTITDTTGDTQSLNINIEIINSDYFFNIKVLQPILKPYTTYPIILKANKSGYTQSYFSVKYNLKEGIGIFKQSDKTISEGNTFNLLKDIETPYNFTPSAPGNYTITFVTTIDNVNYENTLVFEVKKYNLSVLPNNPLWGTVIGSGSYLYDDEVEISSTPSEHYTYLGIYDGEKEITNLPKYTIKIDKEYNLTAKFKPIGYTITTLSSAGGKATADKEIYIINDDATLTAFAESNYMFSHWSKDGAEFSKSNPLTIKVSKNETYDAVFVSSKHKIEVQSTGNGQATIVDNSTGYVDHKGSVTLRAIPSVGYHSIGWWENNTKITDNADITIDNITTNKMYTAKFEINYYAFSCSATTGGSVTPAESNNTYIHGTPKILTATAAISHIFSHWTLNGTTVSDNPTISITITENAEYKAIFVIRKFTVTLESVGSTRSTPSANPSVVDFGSSTTLNPNTHADDYFLGYKIKGSPTFIYGNVVSNITSDTHIFAHYRNNTITVTHNRESPYSVYVLLSEVLTNPINITLNFENGDNYITETTTVSQGTKSIAIRINDKNANNLTRYQLSINKVSSSDTYNFLIER